VLLAWVQVVGCSVLPMLVLCASWRRLVSAFEEWQEPVLEQSTLQLLLL
jgi:hypothetical protein